MWNSRRRRETKCCGAVTGSGPNWNTKMTMCSRSWVPQKTNTNGSNSREYTTESTKEPTKEPMGYCQLWITLCVFYACAKQGHAKTNALEALHGCKTYLRNCTLSPSSKYSQTLPNPPSSDEPLIKIAKSPANMMMIWKTSVHITAFMPPCRTTCSNTSYKQLCYVYKHVDSCGKHMNVISFRLH